MTGGGSVYRHACVFDIAYLQWGALGGLAAILVIAVLLQVGRLARHKHVAGGVMCSCSAGGFSSHAATRGWEGISRRRPLSRPPRAASRQQGHQDARVGEPFSGSLEGSGRVLAIDNKGCAHLRRLASWSIVLPKSSLRGASGASWQ